jgi:tetratricopeptide (TPR) repeat protein
MLEKALEQGGEDWPRRAEILERAGRGNFHLGEKAFLEGHTDRAISRLQTSLSQKPKGQARVHFFLGRCYERLGAYPEAIAAYKAAIQEDETFGRAHYYLAYAYRVRKMYKQAEVEAKLAEKYGVKLDPGFRFLLRYRPTPAPGD